jgi:outer membrane protein OmpA-like peptidoglycan-associated protein
LSLSQKRANACKSFLDNLLVNKSQVLAKGYGETQLVNACDCAPEQLAQCDEAAHALNRRIEFTWFLQK